jgi:hypothetical protein
LGLKDNFVDPRFEDPKKMAGHLKELISTTI